METGTLTNEFITAITNAVNALVADPNEDSSLKMGQVANLMNLELNSEASQEEQAVALCDRLESKEFQPKSLIVAKLIALLKIPDEHALEDNVHLRNAMDAQARPNSGQAATNNGES